MAYKFSEDIQRGILYLSKTDNDFYVQTADLVQADYFDYPAHSKIYQTIRDYTNKYSKLPEDSFIVEEIRSTLKEGEHIIEYEDELEYINKLDLSAAENAEYYLDIAEDFAKKEEMKQAIKDSVVYLKEDKIGAIQERVRLALLISRNVDTGHDYYASTPDRWADDGKDAGEFPVIFPTCNETLRGGHSRKELCMVVAPPGVGKSLYLVNQASECLMQNKKVLYISLEMSEVKIGRRFDSVISLLPYNQLREPSVQLSLGERMKKFRSTFSDSRLVIKEFPTGQATVNTIRALLNQLKTRNDFTPDMICVDYLELLRPCRSIDAEYMAQQRISEELRGLAVEQNCLVWTATQTNRQGRVVKLITDAELGDSYGKIRTTDWALSLNQTEEEYANGSMRAYILKARDAKQRYIVPIKIDYKTLRMSELADDAETGYNTE